MGSTEKLSYGGQKFKLLQTYLSKQPAVERGRKEVNVEERRGWGWGRAQYPPNEIRDRSGIHLRDEESDTKQKSTSGRRKEEWQIRFLCWLNGLPAVELILCSFHHSSYLFFPILSLLWGIGFYRHLWQSFRFGERICKTNWAGQTKWAGLMNRGMNRGSASFTLLVFLQSAHSLTTSLQSWSAISFIWFSLKFSALFQMEAFAHRANHFWACGSDEGYHWIGWRQIKKNGTTTRKENSTFVRTS